MDPIPKGVLLLCHNRCGSPLLPTALWWTQVLLLPGYPCMWPPSLNGVHPTLDPISVAIDCCPCSRPVAASTNTWTMMDLLVPLAHWGTSLLGAPAFEGCNLLHNLFFSLFRSCRRSPVFSPVVLYLVVSWYHTTLPHHMHHAMFNFHSELKQFCLPPLQNVGCGIGLLGECFQPWVVGEDSTVCPE